LYSALYAGPVGRGSTDAASGRSYFARLASTDRTEGLIALSVRWMQPIQQQGRRIPSLSSERVRSTCSFLVSGFFTEITQQIHSLRASGVKVFHIDSASGSEARASRRSDGVSCTTPEAILSLLIRCNLLPRQLVLRCKRHHSFPST
jgi:hypothetical protein